MSTDGLDPVMYGVTSSSELPATQRYEHWLTPLLSDFEASSPSSQQQQDFRGRVTSLVTATSELHDMASDDFEGYRSKTKISRRAGDKLALIYVMQGQVLSQSDKDVDIVADTGQFILFDAYSPTRMRFHDPHFVQINLPRAQLQTLLSANPAPSQISRSVSRSGLAGLLSSHLARFRTLSAQLNTQERLGLLQATEAFATTVVESACLEQNVHRRNPYGLYAAAQNYIRLNLDSNSLNGNAIAAALGCSRATLYRVFSKQGVHLAEHIRELRLQTLARLLQQPANNLPIAQLAWRCGLYDVSNLSRIFRKRFGMTPVEFREFHKSQQHFDIA